MEISTKFKTINIDENQMSLLLDSTQCDAIFPGRVLLRQFKVGDLYLLIAEADPTSLTIVLIDSLGKPLQIVSAGHWYFDCILENVRIVSENAIEFEFGTPYKVEVFDPPRVISPNTKKCHLLLSGLSSNVDTKI